MQDRFDCARPRHRQAHDGPAFLPGKVMRGGKFAGQGRIVDQDRPALGRDRAKDGHGVVGRVQGGKGQGRLVALQAKPPGFDLAFRHQMRLAVLHQIQCAAVGAGVLKGEGQKPLHQSVKVQAFEDRTGGLGDGACIHRDAAFGGLVRAWWQACGDLGRPTRRSPGFIQRHGLAQAGLGFAAQARLCRHARSQIGGQRRILDLARVAAGPQGRVPDRRGRSGALGAFCDKRGKDCPKVPGIGGEIRNQSVQSLFGARTGPLHLAAKGFGQLGMDEPGQDHRQQQDFPIIGPGARVIGQSQQLAPQGFGQGIILVHHRKQQHRCEKAALVRLVQQGGFIGRLGLGPQRLGGIGGGMADQASVGGAQTPKRVVPQLAGNAFGLFERGFQLGQRQAPCEQIAQPPEVVIADIFPVSGQTAQFQSRFQLVLNLGMGFFVPIQHHRAAVDHPPAHPFRHLAPGEHLFQPFLDGIGPLDRAEGDIDHERIVRDRRGGAIRDAVAHGQLIHPQRQQHEHLGIGQKGGCRHRHQQVHRHGAPRIGHVGQRGKIAAFRPWIADQRGGQRHADLRAIGPCNIDTQKPGAFDPVLQGARKIDLNREKRRDELMHQRLLFLAGGTGDQQVEMRPGLVPAFAQKPRFQKFGFQSQRRIGVAFPIRAGDGAGQTGKRCQIAQCKVIGGYGFGLAGGGEGQGGQAAPDHRVGHQIDGKDDMIQRREQARVAGGIGDGAHQPIADPGMARSGFCRTQTGIGGFLHPVVAEQPSLGQVRGGVAQDQPFGFRLGQGALAPRAGPIV